MQSNYDNSHDLIQEFPDSLTDDQKKAVGLVENFIDKESDCFLLKGYAGTGKTFLLKGIAHFLKISKRPFRLMAPTGRAARMISIITGFSAYTMHKNIYSFNDLKEDKIKDEDGTETFEYYFNLKNNDDDIQTIYIVDEASMISDITQQSEFLRFGTGKLLTDLLDFIGCRNGLKRKIIFVGDPAQLPPVNSKISPALDKKYLENTFCLKIAEFELKEVFRQDKISGILNNATVIRKSIEDDLFNKFEIFDKHNNNVYEDIIIIRPENLWENYKIVTDTGIFDDTIIIAYTNAAVKKYNELIRNKLFPGKKDIMIGDKVIIVHNNYNYEIELLNGEFGTIVEVDPIVENRWITLKKNKNENKVYLEFRNICIRIIDKGCSHDINCKMIENLINSPEPYLTRDEMNALYIDFKIRHPALKPRTPEFVLELKTDPYFNALHLKYGYAITCHKAQGGEWNNVFIDFHSSSNVKTAQYFRWAYTAFTRSKNRLFVMNQPNFKPWSKLCVQ